VQVGEVGAEQHLERACALLAVGAGRRRIQRQGHLVCHMSVLIEPSEKDIKTRCLFANMADIEALILENNPIKQRKPRYNINLKDGKTYPVIRITAK
jgi:hypothetical protein